VLNEGKKLREQDGVLMWETIKHEVDHGGRHVAHGCLHTASLGHRVEHGSWAESRGGGKENRRSGDSWVNRGALERELDGVGTQDGGEGRLSRIEYKQWRQGCVEVGLGLEDREEFRMASEDIWEECILTE
jgi:hypothetical protein